MALLYTTIAEVRSVTGMNDSTLISDAYITAKIEMVQGIIDGKVGDVYVTPWTSGTCPDTIKAIALNMTMGLLYQGEYGQDTEGTGIDGDKIFSGAMSILGKIQNQTIKIRDSSGAEITRTNLRKPVGSPNQTTTDTGTTVQAFSREKRF
jgi:hypothetical protein